MFQLINTGQQSEQNAVNIPIFFEMSNADMAKAIEQEITLQDIQLNRRQRAEVEVFLNTLKNTSERQFIDTCLDTCPDAFICSFGFKE